MDTTLDQICRGVLLLEQPRKGYRFNVDSIILAHFLFSALKEPPPQIVDLGAGCGIVGLLLAKWWPQSKVILVELQKELYDLAYANTNRNQLDHRVTCHHGDLREARPWSSPPPDLILCNPPFFKLGQGRTSANAQIASAKHEVNCTLTQLLTTAANALSSEGVLGLIYPHERIEEVIRALSQIDWHLFLYRPVIPLPDRPPSRALLLMGPAEKKLCKKLQPLIVEERPGFYSSEMALILGDA